MKKYIVNGEVAVLYSPGYGAGWFSCNSNNKQCLFEPEIVEVVLEMDKIREKANKLSYIQKRDYLNEHLSRFGDKIIEIAEKLYGDGFYPGGAHQLVIEWIAEGSLFRIDEYDGSESIVYLDNNNYISA